MAQNAISERDWEIMLEENEKTFREKFNLEYTKSLVNNIFEPLNKYYFRTKFVGFEDWPERNNPEVPLIFISNHSGMAFPWDGMMMMSMLVKRGNFDLSKIAVPVVAPMLSQTYLMNPYLIDDFWRTSGGVDATYINVESMMRQSESDFFVYPEGVPGIGKGFNNKYKLQRFSSSFVRMSLKYKSDVVPIMTVNGEYINPFSYTIKAIDRLVNKIGIPFLPLSPILIAIILQPWIFYFGFPANMVYVRGRRMSPHEWTDKSYEELSDEELREITDRIHDSMQDDLNKAVKEHGKRPFKWGNFFKSIFKSGPRLPFMWPTGWGVMFREHHRQFMEKGGEVQMKQTWGSFFKYLLRHPLALSLFIPVIGLLVMIVVGYSKKK